MKAFISYSHLDADLLEEFHRHLAALRLQNLITTWTDREIPAGGIIDEHVEFHIEDADLYIFLISAAFLDSQYCYEKEFKRAIERHEANKAIIVPIILKPCDWKIPQLRKFKALPKDGKAVTSSHWKSTDEAFSDAVVSIRKLIERGTAAPRRSTFIIGETHASEEQRKILKGIGDEVVERTSAHLNAASGEERKKKLGLYHGILWKQFAEHFGLPDGLKSLPVERYEEAKSWLLQYRASNDGRLKRSNPQKFRNTVMRTIWSVATGLGWDKDRVHSFASEVVDYAEPVASLSDLGNKQLETVRDRIRYQATKRGVKRSQTKSRKRKPLKIRQFVADLRKKVRSKPICFCSDPNGLQFYRLKARGAHLLQVEFNENVNRDDEGRILVDGWELPANFDPKCDAKTVGQLLDDLSDKTIQHYELIFGGDHEALRYVGLSDWGEWVSVEFEAKITRRKEGFIVQEFRDDKHVSDRVPFCRESDPDATDGPLGLRALIERQLQNKP